MAKENEHFHWDKTRLSHGLKFKLQGQGRNKFLATLEAFIVLTHQANNQANATRLLLQLGGQHHVTRPL